jgi:hypothetical protein
MKTTTPRARQRHRNIYYWAYPHAPLKDHLLPPTRRAQGRCRSDGYYWHQDIAAAGIYWVAKTIAGFPKQRRFPFRDLDPSPGAKAYFIFELARKLTQVFDAYAAEIRLAVRFRETREFIRRIHEDGSPEAVSLVKEFHSTHVVEFGYKKGAFYRRVDLHDAWLSPEDVALSAAPPKQLLIATDAAPARSSAVREALIRRYPRQWSYARREAIHFARSHQASRPLRFSFFEDHLTTVFPGALSQVDFHLSNRNSALISIRPDWGRRYVDALQRTYDKSNCAWEKVVYRQVEPVLRHQVFSTLKKDGTRHRALTGKAYLDWEHDQGRYVGVEGLNPARLLAAICIQDADTVDHLRSVGVLGKTGPSTAIDALEKAKALSSKGQLDAYAIVEKHLPFQIR